MPVLRKYKYARWAGRHCPGMRPGRVYVQWDVACLFEHAAAAAKRIRAAGIHLQNRKRRELDCICHREHKTEFYMSSSSESAE